MINMENIFANMSDNDKAKIALNIEKPQKIGEGNLEEAIRKNMKNMAILEKMEQNG